jgi:fatty-acyl-CoA synthase
MDRPDLDQHWAANLTFGDLPGEAARHFGDREALCFRDRRYSFRQISLEVDRLARGFIHIGVTPGERVCLWLTNCPEWIFAMFALAKIGAVHVPVNTRFRVADLEYVLAQSEATTLITHDVSGPVDYLAMARELLPVPRDPDDRLVRTAAAPAMRRLVIKSDRRHPGVYSWPDVLDGARHVDEAVLRARAAAVRPADTVFIMYTSGTTGFPKGVMRDHSLLRSMLDRHARLGITEGDVIINYLPLFHIFGYVDGPLSTLIGGHRQVLTETFDADAALDLVEREGATLLHGFETHMKALADAQEARPRNLSSLRTGILAVGMASAVPTAYRARRLLAPLRHVTAYGITEVGANVSMSDLDASDEQACETSGRACPGFELRVVDPETGRDRPMSVPGELWVRTRYMMQGYYGKPEETARALDADGWFHTGDMALLRPDGYMRFIGRYKDMLKVGGENVDPMEVEGHLLRHPAVHQVAVVGYPDARLTEVAVAFVILKEGAAITAEALIAACRGRIASFKIPRHVFLVEDLPTTSSGKIRKVELREQALRLLGS